MGAIVDKLKETRQWKNTLLIVSSDNGGLCGQESAPDSLVSGWGFNGPYRSVKTTTFEGNIRVVSFINGGPRVLSKRQRGSTYDDMFWIGDWMPTIMGLMGRRDLLQGYDMDAVSHVRQLFGFGRAGDSDDDDDDDGVVLRPVRSEYVSIMQELRAASALIEGEYKLVLNGGISHAGVSQITTYPTFDCDAGADNEYAPDVYDEYRDVMLFNIVEDPFESTNLADLMPDLVVSMTDKLNEYTQSAIDNDRYGELASQLAVDPRALAQIIEDGYHGVYSPEFDDVMSAVSVLCAWLPDASLPELAGICY